MTDHGAHVDLVAQAIRDANAQPWPRDWEIPASRYALAAVRALEAAGWTPPPPLPISPTQHCTSAECPFTQSHTAAWCGYSQPRRCECPFDYPEG